MIPNVVMYDVLQLSIMALRNQSDRMALRRHTLFSADNDPVIYCINMIPLWTMPEKLTDEVLANPAISEPVYEFLALRCNQRVEEYSPGRSMRFELVRRRSVRA